MTQKLIQTGLAILIIIGCYWLVAILYLNNPKVETNPLSDVNIESQTFTINCSRDTTLKIKSGSLIIIRKNSFIDDGAKLDGIRFFQPRCRTG